MPRGNKFASVGALVLALPLCWSCDNDPNAVLRQSSNPTPSPSLGAAPVAPAPTPVVAEPTLRTYRDSDFVESEQNRDPFRNFAIELRAKVPVVAQRMVLMPDTGIDDMRLIAIISGIEQPRAMIVDQRGVGYVTTRGDFVGKADVVQQGGGDEALPVALNWRIDRIRDNEVVLSREDPSAPNRPPLTKLIPLHDDDVPVQGAAAKTKG